jgi:RNA polymerase sigma factor (sigma-70 family)
MAEQAGRTREFISVYDAHYAAMIRLALVTTGSMPVAEDIVQEVFADLYRHFDQVDNPGAWLRRSVANRTTSWLRRLIVARRHTVTVRDVSPPSPEQISVRHALRRLTPRQRAVVFFRFYLDLPESTIAAELGMRPGTVKSALHRALTTMRGELS